MNMKTLFVALVLLGLVGCNQPSPSSYCTHADLDKGLQRLDVANKNNLKGVETRIGKRIDDSAQERDRKLEASVGSLRGMIASLQQQAPPPATVVAPPPAATSSATATPPKVGQVKLDTAKKTWQYDGPLDMLDNAHWMQRAVQAEANEGDLKKALEDKERVRQLLQEKVNRACLENRAYLQDQFASLGKGIGHVSSSISGYVVTTTNQNAALSRQVQTTGQEIMGVIRKPVFVAVPLTPSPSPPPTVSCPPTGCYMYPDGTYRYRH